MTQTGSGYGAPASASVSDTTLATLRAAIRLQLSDNTDWPDATLDSYIADAIRAYSNEFPDDDGYTIPVADGDEVPVPVNHWEALIAFVDFRSHWQLAAGEAADMQANTISLSQLNTAGRMAWNRYEEVIDRLTWHYRGQSDIVAWDLDDANLVTGRIY
jgi:hypothetical protein